MKSGTPLLAAAFMALACAAPIRRPDNPVFREGAPVIRIWIDPASNLEKDDLLRGCESWGFKGIRCTLTDDRKTAEVQVTVDLKADCGPNKEGYSTVAWAHAGGSIVMHTQCMRKWYRFGSIDREEVRAVFTHEIGHQLGIWTHVPDDCDPKKIDPKRAKLRTHPNGRQVCGIAIMNPAYDPKVLVPNEIDGLAFDLRDKDQAVVSDLGPVPEDKPGHLCEYRRK